MHNTIRTARGRRGKLPTFLPSAAVPVTREVMPGPPTSWWIGLSREAFSEALRSREEQRMEEARIGKWSGQGKAWS